MDTSIINPIDDFMKNHPELDPSFKPLIEPLLKDSEDQIYQFVMHFLFL